MTQVRSLAFYLPQFHPIPENDTWWCKGFTEWTNVTKAQPQFDGHQQPRLPTDLGFYDLRLPDTRRDQADLARQFGIDGFVYYHYWFHGRRLLERPVDEVLKSGAPDFPFALCWANESWQRRWDGRSGETLLEQTYSENDDRAHIAWLIEAFRDPRYIRIDGKPLFLVYRAGDLPDCARTTEIWREAAREGGIGELFLCRVESMDSELSDPRPLGFDASVEFAPDWRMIDWEAIQQHPLHGTGLCVDHYDSVVERMLAKPAPSWRRFAGVSPGFDNTPRKGNEALVFTGSHPDTYRSWVARTVRRERERSPEADEVVLFVNAWNEWAEGAILEPCSVWGDAFLRAHRDGLEVGTSDNPILGVVLLAESGTRAVMDTLLSLDAHTPGWDFDVVIIDNGALDIRALQNMFPGLPIVTTLRDVAPRDAFLVGRQYVHGSRTIYMTSDQRFEEGWLDRTPSAEGHDADLVTGRNIRLITTT